MKPDHGYAWFVFIASLFCNMLISAVYISPTMFLVNFTDAFGISTYQAGWICSVNGFVIALSSTGSGMLISHFSSRSVGFLGAIFAAVAIAVASQTYNFIAFIFIYSILSGLCLSCTTLPPIVIIQMYFDKKRPFATGMVLTGHSIGVFVLMPLIGYCINFYGWRGALMLVAGIALNICVCASTFLPIQKQCHPSNGKGSEGNTIKKRSILSIATDKTFIMVAISFALFQFGADFMFKVSTPRAELDMGVDKMTASSVISCIGIGGLVSRLICSFLVSLKWVRPTAMFAFSILTGGIVMMIAAFIKDFYMTLVIATIYGALFGMTTTVQTTVLVNLLGVETIAHSQGLLGSLNGIMFLLNVPFAGWMYDQFGTFTIACFIAGAVQCVGGLISIIFFIKLELLRKDEQKLGDGQSKKAVIKVENKAISMLKSNPVLIGSLESLTAIS